MILFKGWNWINFTELTEKELEKLRRLGIIDEIGLRNFLIKSEIERRFKLGESKIKIKRDIANKLNISVDGLNAALYRMKKKKTYIFKGL